MNDGELTARAEKWLASNHGKYEADVYDVNLLRDLLARVQELEAEVAEERTAQRVALGLIKSYQKTHAELQHEVARLKGYAQHKPACAKAPQYGGVYRIAPDNPECTCGFSPLPHAEMK